MCTENKQKSTYKILLENQQSYKYNVYTLFILILFWLVFITQDLTPISGRTSDKVSNCLYFDAFAHDFSRIKAWSSIIHVYLVTIHKLWIPQQVRLFRRRIYITISRKLRLVMVIVLRCL